MNDFEMTLKRSVSTLMGKKETSGLMFPTKGKVNSRTSLRCLEGERWKVHKEEQMSCGQVYQPC